MEEPELYPCYNISNENWFTQTLNGGVTTVFVAFGFVVNIFVIVILRSLRRRSIQNYLIALAVWDNLLLISAFFLYSLSTLLYHKRVMSGYYVHIYPIAYMVSNVSLMGTLWMIVALTVDRYRFIVDPIRFRVDPLASGDSRCTFFAITLLSAIAVSLGVPHLFEMTFVHCFEVSGEVVPTVRLTSLRNNQVYKIGYRVIGGLLFQSLVPVSLLAYLMSRISLELYRARKRRRKMSCAPTASPIRSNSTLLKKGRRKGNSDNLMLLCVVFKFLLSRSLPLAIDIAESVWEEEFQRMPFIFDLVNVSNALVVANSATNFWVYIAVGARFREKCHTLFRRGIQRSRGGASSDLDDVSKDLVTSLGTYGTGGKQSSFLLRRDRPNRQRFLSSPGFHPRSLLIRNPHVRNSTSFHNSQTQQVMFSESSLHRSSSATASSEKINVTENPFHQHNAYYLDSVTNAVA